MDRINLVYISFQSEAELAQYASYIWVNIDFASPLGLKWV